MSLSCVSTPGRFGLSRAATVAAPGTSSSRISSRFASSSEARPALPVTLPPGRLRLVTSPLRTGSETAAKTIGIVVVASLAASAATGPPIAAMTLTRWRTSSAASAGRRP